MKAKLIKHKTDDGLMEIYANIPLGKEYEVDISDFVEMGFHNVDKHVNHKKIMVRIVGTDTYMPIEVLEIVYEVELSIGEKNETSILS